MVLKWIQSVASGARAEPLQQGASEERKSRRETKMVDVVHEVMRKDQSHLDGLVRMGLPKLKREQFKAKVKKRVWDALNSGLGVVDQEMVEEITESMTDVTEADPYYATMCLGQGTKECS